MKVYVLRQGPPGDEHLIGVVTDRSMIPPGVLRQPRVTIESIDLDALPDMREGESVWGVYYDSIDPEPHPVGNTDAIIVPLWKLNEQEEWDNDNIHYRVVIAEGESAAIELAKERYEHEGDINA